MNDSPPAIVVEGLRVALRGSGNAIVDDVSFSIAPGEVLGLVGESGSGKTTIGLSLLGHARRGVEITAGTVQVACEVNGSAGSVDVLGVSREERRRLRGRTVSYVPQDPGAALNPALRIGTQLREVLEVHKFGSGKAERRERLAEMMREVALPDDAPFLRRYPHELSGGQQQRIGLAMAFACRPRVIVLDEPTTGLDVTTQAHVLDTVRELAAAQQAAAVYVTHDLAVVATLAKTVAVVYAGRIVELGPADELFHAAAHPYTRRLIEAIPHIAGRRQLVGIPGRAPAAGHQLDGCAFAPRCGFVEPACRVRLPELRPLGLRQEVRCRRAEAVRARSASGDGPSATEIVKDELRAGTILSLDAVSAGYGPNTVVRDVTIDIAPRECLALVGESGSGKTTLARAIAGLHHQRTGQILLRGEPLENAARARPLAALREIQYIFQNPYSSLNPRRTIGQIIRQPVDLFGDTGDAEQQVGEMLERVSLSADYRDRYPDQLSGGERQRVAIARALVCRPAVLVCDEVTSALDVSVQATIIELLAELQQELGLCMLFVTHNLPLVRSIAERVAVMSEGRVVEIGDVDRVLHAPADPYTRRLLADTPSLETVAG